MKTEFFNFKLIHEIFSDVKINHDSQIVFMQIDIDSHIDENVIDNVVFFDLNLQDEDNIYKFRTFFVFFKSILLDEIIHFNHT